MKLKLLAAVGAAAILATPSLAFADDHGDAGWYLRGNVGYGTHTDMDFEGDLVGDVESEGNAIGSIGVGYDFGNNWRIELDGASLWTDMGLISQLPVTSAKVRTNTGMLNFIYDFDEFGRWAPYVGAGIGIVETDVDAVAHDFVNSDGVYVNHPVCTDPNIACSIRNQDINIGWQALAGLGYEVTDRLTWDTHYRYLDAGTANFEANSLSGVGAHALLTGFRYNFGGKPAPMFTCWDGSSVKALADCPEQPPEMKTCWDGSEILASDTCPVQTQTCWDGSVIPVSDACPVQATIECWDGTLVSDAAFCPVETRSGDTVASLCGSQYRQEIIYYEFDRGQSAETRQTINRILDIGEFCRVDSIRVVGHTDTSGSAAYNLGLSQRRAKDARDELVRQGINSAIITSEGKGETEPFVPTGDGVKEQLNRRTEVLITLSEVGGIN